MTNDATASGKITVVDTSGNDFTLVGGRLLSDQMITFEKFGGIDSTVAFAMDGKSVIEISNENNIGLSRFPPITFGFWFRPGEVYSGSKEVLFPQGDDDVGLICYTLNGKLIVNWWTHQSETNKSQSNNITVADLQSNDAWYHFGMALESIPPNGLNVRVILDSKVIFNGKNLSDIKLSPNESIQLGGIRHIASRKVVLHNGDLGNAEGLLVKGDELQSLNFRGKLADFRVWAGFLSSKEIQYAKALSSVFQKFKIDNSTFSTLLTVPLVRQSVDFSALDSSVVQNSGVIICHREDSEVLQNTGILGFKTVLFRKKSVLSFDSEASIFTFSKKSFGIKGSFKVSGRIRLSSSEGRVAIIIGELLALTWNKSKACFDFTSSDNLSGWKETSSIEIYKPTKDMLEEAMSATSQKWIKFAILIQRHNDPLNDSISVTDKISAKVWYQGEMEPPLKPIDINNVILPMEVLGFNPISIWTYGVGTKQVDDIQVLTKEATTDVFLSEGFEENSEKK